MNPFFKILILVICLSPFTVNAQWTDSMYQDFEYTTFQKYEPVHERINFEEIDYALLHAAIFYETNRQRVLNALPPFKYSKALEKAAFEHSRDMVKYRFVSHTSKVKGKKHLSDRLKLVGLENIYAGENIAYSYALEMKEGESFYLPSQNGGYFSLEFRGEPIKNHTYWNAARAMVTQWMKSPGHRANIENQKYVFLGCGVFLDVPKDSDQPPMFKATQNFSSDDADYSKFPAKINYQK
ncbi:CAP domain-containing protein [Flexithrix dorotheae]|uniref:CAP domain-containing protein n=1 Tax=Flexithrix dorotheae TaxID=70993 RepID=UPI000380CBFB|nr:CAP domain-containing protein [Flexithrix dorotheae]